MSKKKEMIGERFERLVVVSEEEPHIKPSGQKIAMYKCVCDCGNYVVVSGTHLRSGHNQSCGCLKEEQKNHGSTRLVHIWKNMIARCYNEKNVSYIRYGAKGIGVCDSWKNNYEIFEKWALKNGYADHLTLDRIDNSKGYEPINCRWATYKEQANNTRTNVFIEYNGISKTISEWADILNVNPKTIYNRRHKGWDDKRIITTPFKTGRTFPEIAEVMKKMQGGE